MTSNGIQEQFEAEVKTDLSVTQLLQAAQSGDESSREVLIALIYDELHQMARQHLRNERSNHTLQPTALVHEAYLRIFNGEPMEIVNRRHFFGIAAVQMRRILIDHARRKAALKRSAEQNHLTLNDLTSRRELSPEELLTLDEALTRLKEIHPRPAAIVELRYFLGLTETETAEVVDVSLSTMKREWGFARAWLLRELTRDGSRGKSGND